MAKGVKMERDVMNRLVSWNIGKRADPWHCLAKMSAHCILTDMQTLIDYADPSRYRILVAGDLNLIYTATGRGPWIRRERMVWDRFETPGMEFPGPQVPNASQQRPSRACPPIQGMSQYSIPRARRAGRTQFASWTTLSPRVSLLCAGCGGIGCRGWIPASTLGGEGRRGSVAGMLSPGRFRAFRAGPESRCPDGLRAFGPRYSESGVAATELLGSLSTKRGASGALSWFSVTARTWNV